MNRRNFFQTLSQGAALAGLTLGGGRRVLGAEAATLATAPTPKLSPIKITRVKAILTAPARIRLCVVKVETSEPGLYGLGCATFTQRIRTVVTAVQEYLAPFLAGKDPDNIEDLWQAMYQSSYWRNGPVLMNALSGVDAALWDIKGKRAAMPVYQLLGGKCRTAVPVYRHAAGRTPEEVAERARQFMAQGARYIRAQVGVEGQASYGAGVGAGAGATAGSVTNVAEAKLTGEGHFRGEMFEPAAYRRSVPKLFKYLREQLGDDIELLHDMHERLAPIDAIGLAKELEPYRLFFLEDPFAPEDVGYFKVLRQQSATPIAMGELFNNPNEWLDLVSGRLIDFIRCHVSQIGGISAARKIAALCDFYRVRTAWHGPGDTSPVSHAANLHLDLATWNFGIQECPTFSEALREVFPGTPELRDGMLWCNEKAGLGIDLNETLAAKYPIRDDPPFDLHWGRLRDRDGTIRRP
ncbi:MAG TPA: enolase C-terminal domain-like protein [Verrucomicrobiae bacterium]|nr:enolase C-terminal domain-like protein [Verrucomicrobiae bacterium]